MPRRTREEHVAELINKVEPNIPLPGQAFKLGRTLADESEVDFPHVGQAVAGIRERGARSALVSTRDGYRFTEDHDEVTAYRRKTIRTVRTKLRRLCQGVLVPQLRQLPAGEAEFHRRMLATQLNRFLEDVDNLFLVPVQ